MNSFKYFQESFGVKAVIFTDTPEVSDYCKSLNVTTLNVPLKNKYKLPVFPAMLRHLIKTFHYDFYIYVNSDILLNPHVFLALETLKKSIRTPVLITCFLY